MVSGMSARNYSLDSPSARQRKGADRSAPRTTKSLPAACLQQLLLSGGRNSRALHRSRRALAQFRRNVCPMRSRWRRVQECTNNAFGCTAAPTIADGVIYEPRGGEIAMWDEYGDLLGRLGTGGAAGPVTVVDGSVYVSESISGIDCYRVPTATAPKGAPPDFRQLSPDWTLKPYSSSETADR
jgi:hypothetical protein